MILGLEGYICCLHLPPTSDVFVFLMGREEQRLCFFSRVFIYSIEFRMRATFRRKLKVLEDLEDQAPTVERQTFKAKHVCLL